MSRTVTGCLLVVDEVCADDVTNWLVRDVRRRVMDDPQLCAEHASFAGSVDELAIYDKALSPNRIAAHYSTGIFGSHPLAIGLSGAQVNITWTAGTLQQSDNVTGTYADLPGVTSPYKPPAGPASRFYRLRQ